MEIESKEISRELELISTLLQKIVDNTNKIRENTDNMNNICDEYASSVIKDK